MTDETPEDVFDEMAQDATGPGSGPDPEANAGSLGLVLSLGPKNIEMEMRQKVAEALRQPLLPKDLEYLLVPTIIPNQQGQPMPALAICLALKAPVLGQMIQATAILPSPWESQEGVTETVRQLATAIEQGRSQQAMTKTANSALREGGLPPRD